MIEKLSRRDNLHSPKSKNVSNFSPQYRRKIFNKNFD